MPCLNEARTLAGCIAKARDAIDRHGLAGEVIVADNGSTDGSQQIAQDHGARVVNVADKGYGNALIGGIAAAKGRYIVMGDADDSYDFSSIFPFVQKLREGYQLVMGCRLPSGGGRIVPGAMPWKHRWIGNPALTAIGRLFFRSPIHDFHCGLRAFSKEAIERLDMHTTGMEFASEMVIKATLEGLKIIEIPITLYKDGRDRPPHLRSWQDGWRHLRFMLLYSPRWLFLMPGLFFFWLGTLGLIWLLPGPRQIGRVVFDVHTLLFAGLLCLIGFQLVWFSVFANVFAVTEGLLPQKYLSRLFKFIKLESGLVLGFLLSLAGLGLLIGALAYWRLFTFGPLPYTWTMRLVIPAVVLLGLGVQIIFSSFFLSILGLRRR